MNSSDLYKLHAMRDSCFSTVPVAKVTVPVVSPSTMPGAPTCSRVLHSPEEEFLDQTFSILA